MADEMDRKEKEREDLLKATKDKLSLQNEADQAGSSSS